MSTYSPIIGIPCRQDISGFYPGRPVNAQNVSYIQAVMQAGGIPVLIPVEVVGAQLIALAQKMDGILFSGGGDIDPTYYNQPVLVDNLSDVQQERDIHEIGLMQWAIGQRKPFLAICRGVQVMNVAGGGTLYQDLATQNPNTIRHDFYYTDDQLPRNYLAHQVQLERSSRLYQILQTERIGVNSLHHQAIRQVGPLVTPAARSEDGVVEALEVADHPFAIGVQWHPEELTVEQEPARQLFDAFIAASRNGYGR